MRFRSLTVAVITVLLTPRLASAAACVNRYIARQEGPKITVTLLTGKLTFDEAKAYAAAFTKGGGPGPEWVDDKGKTIAKSREISVIRPMPVGCDGRTSGVVIQATLITFQKPSGKVQIKLDANNTVEFTQQAE